MALNTSTLETNLNTKMNATTGTTEGKEFLLLGKAVEALTPTVTVAAVVAEGTTQVGLVNTAGTTQVGLVNTAGTTQIAAVQAAATGYAPLADPTFTGVPAAPTAGAGTNTTQLATTAFVNGEVAALVDSAPGTLDTLNELAAALNDDANFSTTVTNSIATKMPLAGGTFTGDVSFGDNDKAIFGAGSDLQIYHDGTHSFIQDIGTGNLRLKGTDVRIESNSGYDMLSTVDAAGVTLYYANNSKLATTAGGVSVTGTVDTTGTITSGGNIVTGTDTGKIMAGASNDIQIYHDGSHSYIRDTGTGGLKIDASELYISNAASNESMINAIQNGAVTLYYNNAAKIATTSTGADVTGELIADSYNETYSALSGTSPAANCHNGNAFSLVLSGNTTFTFTNPPASGTAYTFSVEIIQNSGGSGYSVTWPSSVDWPAATAPTLTADANAKDIFVFTTRDGGANWYGFTAGQALG